MWLWSLQDIVSEHPERFFVAEIVREKIFLQYRQEIPYACQVCSNHSCWSSSHLLVFGMCFLLRQLWKCFKLSIEQSERTLDSLMSFFAFSCLLHWYSTGECSQLYGKKIKQGLHRSGDHCWKRITKRCTDWQGVFAITTCFLLSLLEQS